VDFVFAGGNSAIILRGGSLSDNVYLFESSTLTVQGSGLSSTGTATSYWDNISGTNYLAAGNFTVTGTLADGSVLNRTFLAGGVSGDVSQQTVVAGIVAPDLFVLEDRAINDRNNRVNVGRDVTQTTNTSPTVVIQDGANLGYVSLYNASTVKVQGGLLNGVVSALGAGSALEVNGGTLADGAVVYPGGNARVTGGAIHGNLFNLGGFVEVMGDTLDSLSVQGLSPGSGGVTNITGGTIGKITGYRDSVTNISGGVISDILGQGGVFNIFGGQIGPNSLVNVGSQASSFNLFGTGLLLTDGTAGIFTDSSGTTFNGVWWNVNGNLASGDVLSTRYFERGGSLGRAGGITFASTSAAAPEPATLGLMALVISGVALSRRRFVSMRRVVADAPEGEPLR
jgi:hypothetical protein